MIASYDIKLTMFLNSRISIVNEVAIDSIFSLNSEKVFRHSVEILDGFNSSNLHLA